LGQIEMNERGYVDVAGIWISDVSTSPGPDHEPNRKLVTFRVRHHVAFQAMVQRLLLVQRFGGSMMIRRKKWDAIEAQKMYMVTGTGKGEETNALPLYDSQQPYGVERDLSEVVVTHEPRWDPSAFLLDDELVHECVGILEHFQWVRALRREVIPKKKKLPPRPTTLPPTQAEGEDIDLLLQLMRETDDDAMEVEKPTAETKKEKPVLPVVVPGKRKHDKLGEDEPVAGLKRVCFTLDGEKKRPKQQRMNAFFITKK